MENWTDLIDEDVKKVTPKMFQPIFKEEGISGEMVDNMDMLVRMQQLKDNKRLIELLGALLIHLKEVERNTGQPPPFSGRPGMR